MDFGSSVNYLGYKENLGTLDMIRFELLAKILE
jgi:hypothetical protein